jgi:hypothetical protein
MNRVDPSLFQSFDSIFDDSTATLVRCHGHASLFQFGAQTEFQLAGGLLGESDCHNLPDLGTSLRENFYDPADEFGGLASSGGCLHN